VSLDQVWNSLPCHPCHPASYFEHFLGLETNLFHRHYEAFTHLEVLTNSAVQIDSYLLNCVNIAVWLVDVVVGIVCFYVCMILYLYGDLAIYAVAVPESLRDVAWYAFPSSYNLQYLVFA